MSPDSSAGRALAVMRDHPVITGVMLVCILLGPVFTMWLLPDDWALWRKLAGGLVAGAGVGLMIVAPRMVGPWTG